VRASRSQTTKLGLPPIARGTKFSTSPRSSPQFFCARFGHNSLLLHPLRHESINPTSQLALAHLSVFGHSNSSTLALAQARPFTPFPLSMRLNEPSNSSPTSGSPTPRTPDSRPPTPHSRPCDSCICTNFFRHRLPALLSPQTPLRLPLATPNLPEYRPYVYASYAAGRIDAVLLAPPQLDSSSPTPFLRPHAEPPSRAQRIETIVHKRLRPAIPQPGGAAKIYRPTQQRDRACIRTA
jgi:hypothetical protein